MVPAEVMGNKVVELFLIICTTFLESGDSLCMVNLVLCKTLAQGCSEGVSGVLR